MVCPQYGTAALKGLITLCPQESDILQTSVFTTVPGIKYVPWGFQYQKKKKKKRSATFSQIRQNLSSTAVDYQVDNTSFFSCRNKDRPIACVDPGGAPCLRAKLAWISCCTVYGRSSVKMTVKKTMLAKPLRP